MKVLKKFSGDIEVNGKDTPKILAEAARMVVEHATETGLTPMKVAEETGPRKRYGIILEIRLVDRQARS